MNVLPVIKREMREEARHALTYWSRVIMAGGVMLSILWYSGSKNIDHEFGTRMFTILNSTLFIAIWLIVPLLTADSLAREKREGTLGLLFMTHLQAREIVLGKSMMHSIRGINLLLTLIPLQIVPVVMGGVSWHELTMAASINSSSVILALAAGMLASALCRQWWHAFPLAVALGLIFMFGATAALFHGQLYLFFEVAEGRLPVYLTMSSEDQHSLISTMWSRSFVLDKLSFQFQYGTGAMDAFAGNWDSFWKEQLNLAGGAYADVWVRISLSLLPLAILITWAIVGFSAFIISKSWRDHPENKHVTKFKRALFSPMLWKKLLRNRLNLQLNSNPVSWLHEYSWKARVTKWSWCLATMVICTHFLNQVHSGNQSLLPAMRILMLTVLLGVSFSAVASFRSEKDSGGMELLLTTHIGTQNIILGQVMGVWKRYLPTIAVIALVWYAVYFDIPGRFGHFRDKMHWAEPLLILSSSFALAMIGMRFSFSRYSLLTGWAMTLGLGLVLPFLLVIFISAVMDFPTVLFFIVLVGLQFVFASRSKRTADRMLNQRVFFFRRGTA